MGNNNLFKLMTLDANMNTSGIEERFEQIAKMLFESFAIQKGETVYLFKEIEFYFYNKNHRDISTHPRVSKPLCWYVAENGGYPPTQNGDIRSLFWLFSLMALQN